MRRKAGPEAAAWRGVERLDRGDYALAAREMTRALDLDPGRAQWVLLCRAACFLSLGKFGAALSDAERHLRLYPNAARRSAEALRARALSGMAEPPLRRGLHWKSAAQRELWEPHFKRAEKIYGEMEYATVREGVRRIMFRNLQREDPFAGRVEKDGLFHRVLFHVKRYEGFANRHDLTTEGDPDSWGHAVIAGRKEDVEEAARLYRDGLDSKGHARLGELLGYPRCCVKFFQRVWLKDKVWDPLFEAARNSRGEHPYCNTLLRYAGIRVASWLTCSFDCPDSIARAGEWVRLGRRIDSDAVDSLLKILSLPLTWSCAEGSLRVDARPFFFLGDCDNPGGRRQVRWLGGV